MELHKETSTMNIFLHLAQRLDRPGYPLHVRALDWMGGRFTSVLKRLS
jgi:hypothetical protein